MCILPPTASLQTVSSPQSFRSSKSHSLTTRLLLAAAPILITGLAYLTQRAQLTSLYNSLWYSGSSESRFQLSRTRLRCFDPLFSCSRLQLWLHGLRSEPSGFETIGLGGERESGDEKAESGR